MPLAHLLKSQFLVIIDIVLLIANAADFLVLIFVANSKLNIFASFNLLLKFQQSVIVLYILGRIVFDRYFKVYNFYSLSFTIAAELT
jgi:hypothetical protein